MLIVIDRLAVACFPYLFLERATEQEGRNLAPLGLQSAPTEKRRQRSTGRGILTGIDSTPRSLIVHEPTLAYDRRRRALTTLCVAIEEDNDSSFDFMAQRLARHDGRRLCVSVRNARMSASPHPGKSVRCAPPLITRTAGERGSWRTAPRTRPNSLGPGAGRPTQVLNPRLD